MTCDPDLVVSLRPYLIAQVRDAFMAIELPSETTTPWAQVEAALGAINTSNVSLDADRRAHGGETAAAEIGALYESVEFHPWTIG